MKNKNLLIIFILLSLSFSHSAHATDASLQQQIASQSYMVIDISNNSVIAEKNWNSIYPIASITKLMNAVISTENIDLSKKIKLTAQMLKPEGYSPSLFLGLKISASNLLQASLIQSVNDAAQSLTYFIGNKKFISLMNQKAKKLGMDDTYYYDAHGLSPKNTSSASDLAKLLSYIYYNHPEILTITKENDFLLPDPTGKLLHFENVNNLSLCPDFIGAKAGYIIESKQTLASVALINNKPIAIVLLNSTQRQADALKIADWIKNNY
jgi:D-alanyl-D-alanine endopeptidase (penicillin-binding protein 7)